MEYQASDTNDIGDLKNIVQQAKRNSELRDVDATKRLFGEYDVDVKVIAATRCRWVDP